MFDEAIRGITIWQGESGMAYCLLIYMQSLGYGTPDMKMKKKDFRKYRDPS
jgi:hypothetical protein